MSQSAERPQSGETALVVLVPEAEPVVSRWRLQLDPAAAEGVPAHVTVLYPFLDRARIDDRVLTRLDGIAALWPAFDVRFAACARFPEVLYLAPEPGAPFRLMTADIVREWPEAPPYGGRFADVVPHLTVGDGADPALLDLAEAAVRPRLPVVSRVAALSLLAQAGDRWLVDRSFALRGA